MQRTSISMKITRELATAPGASVTLHRLTEGRRTALRNLIGLSLAKMRAINSKIDDLMTVSESDRDYMSVMVQQDELDKIQHDEIDPQWIRWGVARVQGLVVEEVELGIDELLDWPSEVYAEVLELVRSSASLGSEQRKNSLSPTTTSEPGLEVQNPLNVALVNVGESS